MRNSVKWILIIGSLLLLILLLNNKQLASLVNGEVKYRNAHIDPGNIEVPHARTMVWKNKSAFADSILNTWANKTVSDKSLDGKGNAPRILLAKMVVGSDIPEVNKTLRRLTVWGNCGSSWALNKEGDYDFTLTILTTIFWKFADRPEVLYPETKDYLLKVLLSEEGNKFSYSAPRTLGLAPETENHMLMTEGSRYLKNRWIMLQGNKNPYYDNLQNGMEHKLLSLLEEMKTAGLYEFNSLPYIGYTITALLNLEAFASEKLKAEAQNVLDYMNWTYALGSYQLKHYPPMRRRYEKAGITDITTDYQSIFMKSWLGFSPVADFDKNIGGGEVHALMGACMPYRPADMVNQLIFDKGNGYFVKLGHGPESCPEIFTSGKHFLLSAGGANQGKMSIIVARPITLFLNDQAEHLPETFHLSGPGKDFMKWNNTGVYKNFACAAGPVSVPSSLKPTVQLGNWSLYPLKESLTVAVYSTGILGIMLIFEGSQPEKLLNAILTANPAEQNLNREFKFPGGQKIEYDVLAPKNKWVITTVDGQTLDRDFDKWPLIEGDYKVDKKINLPSIDSNKPTTQQ